METVPIAGLASQGTAAATALHPMTLACTSVSS